MVLNALTYTDLSARQYAASGLGLLDETVGIDDESLVGAFSDEAGVIAYRHAKDQPATVNLYEFGIAPYTHPDGCGGQMSDIYKRSDSRLPLVKIWLDAAAAGLFDQRDHHRSRKYGNGSAADALGSQFGGDSHLFPALDSNFHKRKLFASAGRRVLPLLPGLLGLIDEPVKYPEVGGESHFTI